MENKKTISKFVSEYLDSHDIYDSEELKKLFIKETGLEPCWGSYTERETRQAMKQRGLGGELSKSAPKRLAYGYDIVESLAKKYSKYDAGRIQGRGTRFRMAITALKESGN